MRNPEAWIAQTARLRLRELTLGDAAFILRLVNEPDWLRFIGDRGVHDLASAENYLRTGPLAMYAEHGFGLYAMQWSDSGQLLGLCGLLKRITLDDVDIGFAVLAEFAGHGLAQEAAQAVLQHGFRTIGLQRIVAIVNPDNARSIRLLEKLGMHYAGVHAVPAENRELALYALDATQGIA